MTLQDHPNIKREKSVVFGVIRDANGKVLLMRRQNTGLYSGYDCFPGGHVDPDEMNVYASLDRELHEEIGTKLGSCKFGPTVFNYPGYSPLKDYNILFINILDFEPEQAEGLYNKETHKSEYINFVDPLDLTLNLPPFMKEYFGIESEHTSEVDEVGRVTNPELKNMK